MLRRTTAAAAMFAAAFSINLCSSDAHADGPAAPLPAQVATPVDEATAAPAKDEWYSLHFQGTVAVQTHPSFPAAYSGLNSMNPNAETATSSVADMYGAIKLWHGAHACFQPEIWGGLGLSTTLGMADFPSGEVYRVGDPSPAFVVGRAYVQQVFGLGGGTVQVDTGPCQLAGTRDANALTLTFGRLNMPDQFDNNPVSNDPHNRFTNWGTWASSGYDYAADTHGYTYGLTADVSIGDWSARAGYVLEPLYANQMQMDFDFWRSFSIVVEGERRWSFHGHPGGARLLGAVNVARMGDYTEAYSDPQYDDNVTATRAFGRQKYNLAASANQELAKGLATYLRLAWNDGATETWAFTEVDRSISAGVVQTGWRWSRPDDAVGLAFVGALLSPEHRSYLASGGYGYIIGDGALVHYGPEMVIEAFYEGQITSWFAMGADYQLAINPAYNQDRGPIHIFMLRGTVAF